ncbi:hypothetical protein L7F22_040203 [Adiantum nelumboides]|nr:hypothetical protein [Adiantum nelumboides]
MAMAWLRACAFLLVSLLLARKVCSYIGGWLFYARVWLYKRSTKGTTSLKGRQLQVILCGFPRTGTLSLMQALGILGFPCFHGMHLAKPTTAQLYLKAFTTGNSKYWEKLLDGYASIADFPGTCAYKQLMEIFPHAKVILNIRDPNKWKFKVLGRTFGWLCFHSRFSRHLCI